MIYHYTGCVCDTCMDRESSPDTPQHVKDRVDKAMEDSHIMSLAEEVYGCHPTKFSEYKEAFIKGYKKAMGANKVT